jgi:hypothetical protein
LTQAYKLDIIFYLFNTVEDTNHNRVTFNATVMAAVIAEATGEADDDQFLEGNFTQLQDVDDVYDDDEPDIVICAHVINTNHLDIILMMIMPMEMTRLATGTPTHIVILS